MRRKFAAHLLVVPLIGLFLYAAITKLSDYPNFQFGLSESPFISPFAGVLAWAVPSSELLIVVLLALPVTRLIGLYAFSALMLFFTIYIAAMLLSSSEIPCSCGGVLEQLSWPMHLVFNSVFILLGVLGIWLERKRKKSRTIPVNLRIYSYAERHPSTIGPH